MAEMTTAELVAELRHDAQDHCVAGDRLEALAAEVNDLRCGAAIGYAGARVELDAEKAALAAENERLKAEKDDMWEVSALRVEREAHAKTKAAAHNMAAGIMRCIAADWQFDKGRDWSRPELVLAEYVGDIEADRDRLKAELAEAASSAKRLVLTWRTPQCGHDAALKVVEEQREAHAKTKREIGMLTTECEQRAVAGHDAGALRMDRDRLAGILRRAMYHLRRCTEGAACCDTMDDRDLSALFREHPEDGQLVSLDADCPHAGILRDLRERLRAGIEAGRTVGHVGTLAWLNQREGR